MPSELGNELVSAARALSHATRDLQLTMMSDALRRVRSVLQEVRSDTQSSSAAASEDESEEPFLRRGGNGQSASSAVNANDEYIEL